MARMIDDLADEPIHTQAAHITAEFWRWHAGPFQGGDSWSPAVNVYRYPDRLTLCVDLAGLRPSEVEVRVEPGRLTLSGHRPAPEPPHQPGEPMRIVSMEIDHGRFRRRVPLPVGVDPQGVESSYHDGYLWITLPLR